MFTTGSLSRGTCCSRFPGHTKRIPSMQPPCIIMICRHRPYRRSCHRHHPCNNLFSQRPRPPFPSGFCSHIHIVPLTESRKRIVPASFDSEIDEDENDHVHRVPTRVSNFIPSCFILFFFFFTRTSFCCHMLYFLYAVIFIEPLFHNRSQIQELHLGDQNVWLHTPYF